MNGYCKLSSTFIISATLLFCVNRLYEAITSVGLTTTYYLSVAEKLTYAASFGFFAVGAVFLCLALKENAKK